MATKNKAEAKAKAEGIKAEAKAKAKSIKTDLPPLKEKRSSAFATVVALLAIVAAIWASHALGSNPESWLSKLLKNAAETLCGAARTQFSWGPFRVRIGCVKDYGREMRPFAKVSFRYPNRPVRQGKAKK